MLIKAFSALCILLVLCQASATAGASDEERRRDGTSWFASWRSSNAALQWRFPALCHGHALALHAGAQGEDRKR